jgi:hypothetical protein
MKAAHSNHIKIQLKGMCAAIREALRTGHTDIAAEGVSICVAFDISLIALQFMDALVPSVKGHIYDVKNLVAWLIMHRHDYCALALARKLNDKMLVKHLIRCMVLQKRPPEEISTLKEHFSFKMIQNMSGWIILNSAFLTSDMRMSIDVVCSFFSLISFYLQCTLPKCFFIFLNL